MILARAILPLGIFSTLVFVVAWLRAMCPAQIARHNVVRSHDCLVAINIGVTFMRGALDGVDDTDERLYLTKASLTMSYC